MPYDVFISYSRRDNGNGCITEFVARISRDFESQAEQATLMPREEETSLAVRIAAGDSMKIEWRFTNLRTKN